MRRFYLALVALASARAGKRSPARNRIRSYRSSIAAIACSTRAGCGSSSSTAVWRLAPSRTPRRPSPWETCTSIFQSAQVPTATPCWTTTRTPQAKSCRSMSKATTKPPSAANTRSGQTQNPARPVHLRLRKSSSNFCRCRNSRSSSASLPAATPAPSKAASLWHLLMFEPELSNRYLVPILERLRPDWQLASFAEDLKQTLLQIARANQPANRPRWEALVAQLADDHYAVRERAERQLRAAGRAALPYLQSLQRSDLDAEQWQRVSEIVAASSDDREDTPERTAVRMLDDRSVWLSLLRRPAGIDALRRRRSARAHWSARSSTSIPPPRRRFAAGNSPPCAPGSSLRSEPAGALLAKLRSQFLCHLLSR